MTQTLTLLHFLHNYVQIHKSVTTVRKIYPTREDIFMERTRHKAGQNNEEEIFIVVRSVSSMSKGCANL